MRDDRRLELGLAVVPALLVLLTLVVVFDPRLAPAIVNQPLDLVTMTTDDLSFLAASFKLR